MGVATGFVCGNSRGRREVGILELLAGVLCNKTIQSQMGPMATCLDKALT